MLLFDYNQPSSKRGPTTTSCCATGRRRRSLQAESPADQAGQGLLRDKYYKYLVHVPVIREGYERRDLPRPLLQLLNKALPIFEELVKAGRLPGDELGASPGGVVGSPRSRPGHSAREASVSAPAHLPELEEEASEESEPEKPEPEKPEPQVTTFLLPRAPSRKTRIS